jgi:hypothetical protein
MTFRRTRGRPRKPALPKDTGTPELIHKRAYAVTQEALDLCLEKGHITPEQHGCGMHLRWLYTLRYGAPSVRAVDPLHFGGRDLDYENPQWRREREQEYHDAILAMGLDAWAVLKVCAYNQRPSFLNVNPAVSVRQALARQPMREQEWRGFNAGLERLARHWRRGPKRRKPASGAAETDTSTGR